MGSGIPFCLLHETCMNISRQEQRALHALALGGHILRERDTCSRITTVTCLTRDGMILADFDRTIFHRLWRKRLIESRAGSPYRISKRGRLSVRAQSDNRGV